MVKLIIAPGIRTNNFIGQNNYSRNLISGRGVFGDVNVQGNIGIAGTTILANTIITNVDSNVLASNLITSNLIISNTIQTSNLTVSTNSTIQYLSVTGTIQSTSVSTGALVVSDGIGIGGNVWVGGNVLIGGNVSATAYNTTSDYRIKKNISKLDSTYSVDNLEPIKYTNIKNSNTEIGLIAHELQYLYPYLVSGEKDGENLQTVNYTGLIGILINEIKFLKQRVCELEKKIQ